VAVASEAELECRRREDRGTERVRRGDAVTWGGVWGAPSPENFSIFELKKASFGASLVLFFAVD